MAERVAELVAELVAAFNRHDAAAVAALFAPDYDSRQPAHPSRDFVGREQVRANWTSVFEGVPDFVAEPVDSVSAGDVIWTEMRWSGTHRDGSPFLMQGVAILGVRHGLIAWARLYLEPVDQDGADIDAAVEELYRPTATSD